MSQLSLPGMPKSSLREKEARCCTITPGQMVRYRGRVHHGPRYGSRGVVKQTLRRKAIVDMEYYGTWYIPYHLLAIPQQAA